MDSVSRFFGAVGAVLVIVLVTLMLYDVVMRYVVNAPTIDGRTQRQNITPTDAEPSMRTFSRYVSVLWSKVTVSCERTRAGGAVP